MEWVKDDGGRADAGYKGTTGDCVCRAIAIATSQSYQTIYDELNTLKNGLRQTKRVRGSHSRTGVFKQVYGKYLAKLGWKWVACMHIGTGCNVHLKSNELPSGTLIVRLSRHLACVVDGVLHDLWDCLREGTRCVYGYYMKGEM